MADETALEILAERLPRVPDDEREAYEARVASRRLSYPFGSGQGDEIALRAGLRPMIRELLHASDIDAAIARFERAGFVHEIAETLYGETQDGWLPAPRSDATDARAAVYFGRDRGALREAAALEVTRDDEADAALGRLLGYPRCCVTAFVEKSRKRRAPELHAAALARTTGRPRARLNGLDLAIFHFIPWSPCSFECEHSSRYADALAGVVAKMRPEFVESIDRALARHRLMLAYEVQLSIDGAWDGRDVRVERIEPTAADRHPQAALTPAVTDVVARALYALRTASTISVWQGRLMVDGAACVVGLPSPLPLIVPFG